MYNVAVGDRTTLNDLFNAIKAALNENGVKYTKQPVYREFRPGDVRHSQASIEKIESKLGFKAKYQISHGIELSINWYIDKLKL